MGGDGVTGDGRRSGWRRRPVVLAVVLGLLVVSCGGDGEDAPSGTVPPSTVRASDATLVLGDVRDLVGFGFDIRRQPLLDEQELQLASLRGPCGTEVDTPFLADGALLVLRSTVSLIVEVVTDPGVDAATATVAELRDDAVEGCPTFDERLGAGAGDPSTVELDGVLDLGAAGDEAVGWRQTVTDPDGRVGERLVTVARSGGRLVVIVVLVVGGDGPVPGDQMVELARRAGARAFATS